VRRCLSAGFTSHLTKPVNFGQLETMIESALNLKAEKGEADDKDEKGEADAKGA
jgi:DNA-binding NtrC family response regulator